MFTFVSSLLWIHLPLYLQAFYATDTTRLAVLFSLMEYELANVSSASYLPSDSLSTYIPSEYLWTCLSCLVANLGKSIMNIVMVTKG